LMWRVFHERLSRAAHKMKATLKADKSGLMICAIINK